jgi:hypothetical protein
VQEFGHHLEVLLARQHVVDRSMLAGEADRTLHADRVGAQVMAGDGRGARIGPH